MAKGRKTGGRQAGTPNKVTAAAKEAFSLAFVGIGGVPALTDWARSNPTEFYKLFARLIPVEHADENGNALPVMRVEFVGGPKPNG